MSYLTQMLGLDVQNFLSAATGMAVLVALIRGFDAPASQIRSATSGWISRAARCMCCCRCRCCWHWCWWSQGVVQSFSANRRRWSWCSRSPSKPRRRMRRATSHRAQTITEQTIPLGPAASQIAIKQLGTNGGGFFNVNSAHPLREPDAAGELPRGAGDPADPGGAVFHVRSHGAGPAPGMGGARRHDDHLRAADLRRVRGRAGRQSAARHVGAVDQVRLDTQAGGNMEGKEVRFGIANSALWASGHHGCLQRLGELDARLLLRRSAAWCRCG